jgi:anti-anti-sigma regulatory factor
MFRITVHEDAQCLTLQLEGRLAGRWVQELEECWQRTAATQQKPIVRVDLTGVTFVDAEGQACLVGLHRQGVELVAADCLTKAIVAEILEARRQDAEHFESEAKRDCDAERKSRSRERT